jgi:formylglycine-generating enzyme required for sulfatase activity
MQRSRDELRLQLSGVLPRVRLIPAGRLLMGSAERELSGLAKRYGGTRESYREETPQHAVDVDAFALGDYPLNRAVIRLWRDAAAEAAADDRLPAVGISWHDAQAICAWLNELQPAVWTVGLDGSSTARSNVHWRLPTEAEWEYAARGADSRQFPWGDQDAAAPANTREAGVWTVTAPGGYPGGVSPFGIHEMAGTVWEWTASLDRQYPYRDDDGRNDPQAAGRRILRGGCYANPIGYARCACRFRLLPQVFNDFLGIRPALDLPA